MVFVLFLEVSKPKRSEEGMESHSQEVTGEKMPEQGFIDE